MTSIREEAPEIELGPRSGNLTYLALGRVVESDLPLPLDASTRQEGEVVISRSKTKARSDGEAVFQNLTLEGETLYTVRLYPETYVWEYPRLGTFEVTRDGSTISWWVPGAEEQDVATLLCGPILGFALQLQGLTGLHGTALVKDGCALGLLAPSGYGKSTLATVLLRRGLDLLTDDVLATEVTESGVFVLPSRPQLKLWPDSVKQLLPGAAAEPLTNYLSWLDKRVYTPSAQADYLSQPARLTAMFALVPSDSSAPIEINMLRGKLALITLLGLGYQAGQLSRESKLVDSRMDHLGKLAERVPLYTLTCPRSFERLDELADLLVRQFESTIQAEA